MSGIEGLGEAVTGGIIARAVEPSAGEARAEEARSCLNCGTALAGEYCHLCGQRAQVHRSLSAFWHDIAHSVLHFEGKIWRTLPLLAWRPGEMTRRYIAGERARFVSPMALFLFTVFLMFASLSALGGPSMGVGAKEKGGAAAKIKEIEKEVATIEAKRRVLVSKGEDTTKIDEDLAEAKTTESMMRAATGNLPNGKLFEGELTTGWGKLDEGIAKANSNPALLVYKLRTNAYKFSWALIPISVPFLWLLFLHRRRYRQEYRAYDHLVFVTYSITFMSMLLIAVLALRSIGFGGGLFNTIMTLIPPVHMYRQLRGAYDLTRTSALWRTAALLFFAFQAMSLFTVMLLLLGVLG
jgi:hypothetical protein